MNPVSRVSVISTGRVRIRPQHARSDRTPQLWWLLTSRRWTQPLPINVFVIEHRDGIVLFDAGQDRRSVTDPHYFPRGIVGWLYRRLARFDIGPEDTVPAQLRRLGLDPARVSTIVLSHLHQDHIGAIGQFPGARIVVSAVEWGTLDGPMPELAGLLADHIRVPGLNWELATPVPTADQSIAPFTSSHDVLGDGSLLLLPTPGHTPGSMSLVVRPAHGAPVLLIGDLSYDVNLLDAGHLPGVGRRAQLLETTRRVTELRERIPGLLLLAAHDPAVPALLTDPVEVRP